MNNKVLMIGIDSMDSVLLSEFEDEMPNLRKLKEAGADINFEGVYPPDSPTSWASIYTGLNPAKHGVVFFMDPLEKTGKLIKEELDNSTVKGRTFWDLAGKFGKKVFVFYPLLGYPVWEVNGIMVGRATTKRDVQMHPPIEKKKKLLESDNLKGIPGRNPKEFINHGKALMHKETEFALKYIKEDWDLFFFYSSVLDSIQHDFWNCFDKTDPTYKEGNGYELIIPEFYKEYDKIVGKFIGSVSSDVTVVILSDHGHMRRPVNIVNVNKILKEKGYLSLNPTKKSLKRGIYRRRATVMDTIVKYRLGGVAVKILRTFPRVKSLFTSQDLINWEDTVAYVSDLSGIKAYTYGGIVIKKDKMKKKSYQSVRNDIINTLFALKHPVTEKSLLKWIKKREQLYDGRFIEKYPDIVFEFYDDYGAGLSPETSLITSSDSHNIQPGSHRRDTPILFIYNKENSIQVSRNHATLMDVAPTVLDLLGVKGEFGFDGGSIFGGRDK